MPYPRGYVAEQLGNCLIYDELTYNVAELQQEFKILFNSLTGFYLFLLVNIHCLLSPKRVKCILSQMLFQRYDLPT